MSHGIFYCSLKIVLKNNVGQILALESERKGELSGFYDLPGGRIDKKEIGFPFESSIDREVVEEIGDIQFIINSRPIFATTWQLANYPHPFIYIYYEGQYKSGDIKISNEHISYKWVDLNEQELKKHFTKWHYKALSEYYKI
jgi:8-oxo-dGTP pyrophosphatase MutT (NUDIX family)